VTNTFGSVEHRNNYR